MALTFTKVAQTLSPATDTMISVTTTVVGSAIEVQGSLDRYAALGLTLTKSRTLFFTPDVYAAMGTEPAIGATVPWAGETFTVQDVHGRVAPDGFLIMCRVVIES